MNQLLVIPVVVVWDDRDAVLELVQVGIGSVIDQQHILHLPILQHSQVLDIDALLGLPALASEESVADVLVLRVEVVEDHIGVAFVTGREDNDLAHLRHFFQELLGVGTDVDPRINDLASGELDLEGDIMGKAQILVAVNECLVKVQDE